jgi:hypothetical protein
VIATAAGSVLTHRFDAAAFAAGGNACNPRILGIGADSGHHEHRNSRTGLSRFPASFDEEIWDTQAPRPHAHAAVSPNSGRATIAPRDVSPSAVPVHALPLIEARPVEGWRLNGAGAVWPMHLGRRRA